MDPNSPLRQLYLDQTVPSHLPLDQVRNRDRVHRLAEAGAVVVIAGGVVAYTWHGTPTDLLVALLLSAFLVVAFTRSWRRVDRAEWQSPLAYVEELGERNRHATQLWQPLWPLVAAAIVIIAVNAPPLLRGDGTHWYLALALQVAVWCVALWGRRKKLAALELEAHSINALGAQLKDPPTP
jgi:hypothetical protein